MLEISWSSLMFGIGIGCVPTTLLLVGAAAWDDITEKRRKNNGR